MTKNEILEYFKDINHAYNDCTRYDTLKRMLDELQEPCTDAISREDALQALCKAVHKNDDTIPCRNQIVSCRWDKTKVQDYAEEILKLSSVTPAEKVGKWVTTITPLGKCCTCSKCGSCPPIEYRYCPYCGTKMGGTQHEKN